MSTKCPIKNADGTIDFNYTITDDYLLSDHSYGVNFKGEKVRSFLNYDIAETFIIGLYCGNNTAKCTIENKNPISFD